MNIQRQLFIFLLIAIIVMTVACGKDKPAKGEECSNCASNSECNDGLTCSKFTFGYRCADKNTKECKIR